MKSAEDLKMLTIVSFIYLKCQPLITVPFKTTLTQTIPIDKLTNDKAIKYKAVRSKMSTTNNSPF